MRGVKVKAVPLHAKQTLEPQLEGTGCGQRHALGRIIPGKKDLSLGTGQDGSGICLSHRGSHPGPSSQ